MHLYTASNESLFSAQAQPTVTKTVCTLKMTTPAKVRHFFTPAPAVNSLNATFATA